MTSPIREVVGNLKYADPSQFVSLPGAIVVGVDGETISLHDGVTPGGLPIATTGPTGPTGSQGPTGPTGPSGEGADYLDPGQSFLFNGPTDQNWRMGLGLEDFSTALVGAATSIQIITGTGSGGPDGFAIGQTGGSSLMEIRGDDGAVLLPGLVSVGGSTPASSSAAGIAGTITWDANYLYICVATNTWQRVATASW